MNREDVVRITETVLKGLSLGLAPADFTDPNRRTIHLMFGKEKVSEVSIDVTQRDEYEG